jgi:hypothetical protein
MPRRDRALFNACRAEAEAMVVEGEPLEAVELMLDEVPLVPDDRDAVWLFAWSLRERVAPVSRVRRRLVAVGDPSGSGP